MTSVLISAQCDMLMSFFPSRVSAMVWMVPL